MNSRILKIFICCEKYEDRIAKIKEECNKINIKDYLIFLGGEKEEKIDNHTIKLKCGDLYEDLPEKMFSVYQYLCKNKFPEMYDYFWKIDDDVNFARWNTLLYNDLLNSLKNKDYAGFKLKFLDKNKEPNREWHFGRVSEKSIWHNVAYQGKYETWADGGSTYFLSSKSLTFFLNENPHTIGLKEIYEDVAVANFLKLNNISPRAINPWTGDPVLRFNIYNRNCNEYRQYP